MYFYLLKIPNKIPSFVVLGLQLTVQWSKVYLRNRTHGSIKHETLPSNFWIIIIIQCFQLGIQTFPISDLINLSVHTGEIFSLYHEINFDNLIK